MALSDALMWPGSNRAASDRTIVTERENFLTRYSGIIFGAAAEGLSITNTIMKHTLLGASAEQFIFHGRVEAQYYDLGTSQSAMDSLRVGTRTITVDRPIYTMEAFHDFDDKLAHYSMVEPVAKEQGRELARAMEQKAARAICKATLTTGLTVSTGYSFPSVTATGGIIDLRLASNRAVALTTGITSRARLLASDFTSFSDALRAICVRIENAGLSPTEFVCGMDPEVYSAFAWSDAGQKLRDKDYNSNSASYSEGTMPTILGLRLQKAWGWTTAIGQSTTYGYKASTHEYAAGSAYTADNTYTAAVIYNQEVVGMLESMPVRADRFYDDYKQSWMLRGQCMNGFDYLQVCKAFRVKLYT